MRVSTWRSFWALPVVYVIENNQYAMGTSGRPRLRVQTNLSKRGESFNIPGEQVDGMDVRAVGALRCRRLRDWCRAVCKGPYLLEMMTYRYRGHSMSDPAKYRAKAKKSPRCGRSMIRLSRCGCASSAVVQQRTILRKSIRTSELIVGEAADFAQSSPEPDPSELWTDVLAVNKAAGA